MLKYLQCIHTMGLHSFKLFCYSYHLMPMFKFIYFLINVVIYFLKLNKLHTSRESLFLQLSLCKQHQTDLSSLRISSIFHMLLSKKPNQHQTMNKCNSYQPWPSRNVAEIVYFYSHLNLSQKLPLTTFPQSSLK